MRSAANPYRRNLAVLDSIPFVPFDADRVEEEFRCYLADWPILARQHPAQTHQILRKSLPGRIRVLREVHGNEKRYHFDGEAAA